MRYKEIKEARVAKSAPQNLSVGQQFLKNLLPDYVDADISEYKYFSQQVNKELQDAIKGFQTKQTTKDQELGPLLYRWFASKYGPVNPRFQKIFQGHINNISNAIKQDGSFNGQAFLNAQDKYTKTLYKAQTDAQEKAQQVKATRDIDDPNAPPPTAPASANNTTPAAATASTPTSGKKRTGGRKKGQLSNNPRAVARRKANAAKRAAQSGAAQTNEPFTFGGETYTKGPNGWVDSKNKLADKNTSDVLDRAAAQDKNTAKPRVRIDPNTGQYVPVNENIIRKYVKLFQNSLN